MADRKQEPVGKAAKAGREPVRKKPVASKPLPKNAVPKNTAAENAAPKSAAAKNPAAKSSAPKTAATARSSAAPKTTKESAATKTPTARQGSAPKAGLKRAQKGEKQVAEQNATKETAASARQAANAALWVRFADGNDPGVREELILQYAPLVKYVIGRLAISLPAIVDYEDILSYGTIGLIEAVERYDHTKGVKFETYAISRIRGAIIDALRALDRLPRSVRQKAKNADAAIVQLTAVLGRDPTDQEVADTLEIPLPRYLKDIVDASWVTVSLDNVGSVDMDDDGPAEISVADPDADAFTLSIEQEELIGELADVIQELPEREQLVLSLYYKEELTMREISQVLGVSESRICQLHARSLTRLRGGMAARQQRGEAA